MKQKASKVTQYKCCDKCEWHECPNAPTPNKNPANSSKGWEEKDLIFSIKEIIYNNSDSPKSGGYLLENLDVVALEISTLLQQAVGEERKYIGKLKREWYMKGVEDTSHCNKCGYCEFCKVKHTLLEHPKPLKRMFPKLSPKQGAKDEQTL